MTAVTCEEQLRDLLCQSPQAVLTTKISGLLSCPMVPSSAYKLSSVSIAGGIPRAHQWTLFLRSQCPKAESGPVMLLEVLSFKEDLKLNV